VLAIPISKVNAPSKISFFICASAAFKSLANQSKDTEGGPAALSQYCRFFA
jgi:hypothetical protein